MHKYYLHCGVPYFDENGNFAGGIAIATEVNDLYTALTDFDSDEKNIRIIMNNEGKIILSSEEEGFVAAGDNDLRLSRHERLANIAKRMTNMENDVVILSVEDSQNKTDYYIAFAPINVAGWSFATVLEDKKVNAASDNAHKKILEQMDNFQHDINRIFLTMSLLTVVLIALMLAFMLPKVIRRSEQVVKPIQYLVEGVEEIAKGNFDRKLAVAKENEIGTLAEAVNSMAAELKTYMTNLTKVTAEKERVATELNVATNIQLSMLPHDFDFGRTDFEIFATMHAAKEVGGDFYDFYMLDDNHLMITIADVSGKGVPADLFMATSKVILKNFALTMQNPDELSAVMTLANQQICQGNDEMMFVTVFMGMLDLKSGRFIYVNGGHNPPLVSHNRKFEYMSLEQNCVLGMMDDIDFVQQEIQLAAGDVLFLYTDGVTEAMSETREQYGEERLIACLNSADCACDLHELLARVRDDLNKHVKTAPQSDDITMLAVRFN